MSEVTVRPDKVVPSAWCVEVTDAEGVSHVVTTFAGDEAEKRAREYANGRRSRDKDLLPSDGHGRPA
jgi:hypothetical protein